MYIPRNHEKLQTISEIVREELEQHIESGGAYYDDKAGIIAARAIQTFMPELASLQHERVTAEAGSILALGGEEPQFFNGGRIEARLERIAIQQLISSTEFNGSPISLIRHDLFAVLVPLYRDPDPVDLVFGQELLVPFETISEFEAAA